MTNNVLASRRLKTRSMIAQMDGLEGKKPLSKAISGAVLLSALAGCGGSSETTNNYVTYNYYGSDSGALKAPETDSGIFQDSGSKEAAQDSPDCQVKKTDRCNERKSYFARCQPLGGESVEFDGLLWRVTREIGKEKDGSTPALNLEVSASGSDECKVVKIFGIYEGVSFSPTLFGWEYQVTPVAIVLSGQGELEYSDLDIEKTRPVRKCGQTDVYGEKEASGTLNEGESFPLSNIRLILDGVSPKPDASGAFSVQDQNQVKIDGFAIAEGDIHAFSVNGIERWAYNKEVMTTFDFSVKQAFVDVFRFGAPCGK